MRPVGDFSSLLAPVRDAARELSREELPGLLGALADLSAEVLLSRVSEAAPRAAAPRDRGLSPGEVASILGRSRDWVYRHRHELPGTRLSSGRWVVSEAALRRWLELRQWDAS